MKKLFTLAFSAMFLLSVGNVFAQDEEDVTKYLSNPGFDEDLTFDADGTMKTAISTDKSFSDRSWGYLAADSTVYARPKSTSSQKRSDGRKMEAVNGFFAHIAGWTRGDASYTGKSYYPYGNDAVEWVYFGTVPYDLGSTAVPIADDGTTYLEVPAKPEADNGDDNKAFLYLRAGWGGAATYKQVVKLPCAQYRLEYWAININPSATKGENLSRVVCRKDEFKDETGFTDTEWTLHTIEFTPTAEFSLEFGFKSEGGSGGNPFLCIDGIKLYKIGEADEEELLQSDLGDYITELQDLYTSEPIANYDGLAGEADDFVQEVQDAEGKEALEAAIALVKDYIQKMKDWQTAIEQYEALCAQADEIMNTPEDDVYPGYDDFSAAYDDIISGIGDADSEEFADYIDQLQAAIWAYRFSQPASEEEPADYTFFVDNPTFAAKGAWYIGQDGGDQRLKSDFTDGEGNQFTGWNAWRNNLGSADQSVSISQDLTGLPNGYYTVTAEMCTQDGCITDQHVFANGSAQNAESPVMTMTGWDPYVFEPLTTAKVLVVDGKLTIGAIGHGADTTPAENGGTLTDHRCGWFCVTNFQLNYLGEATEEEIAAVIAAKYADAEAYVEAMHFAGDKATAAAAVAAAKEAADLDALKAALTEAEASETEYSSVINGTYKSLQDSIAKYPNSNSTKVTQVVVDMTTAYLTAAEATYKEVGTYTEILRYYLNTLTPAIDKAEQTEFKKAEAKAAVTDVVNDVVAELKALAELPTTEYLAEKVAAINEVLAVAEKSDIEYGDGVDVTAYITNAAITDANVTGWTVNKITGDGSGAKNGQAKNGDGNDYYIDTYNGTAGAVRANYYQVLNVPNGVYELSADQRNAGGGYYLFASTAAPVQNEDQAWVLDAAATNVLSLAKPVATNVYKYVTTLDVAQDSVAVYADTYGEYWMAAADKYIELTGASAGEEISLFDAISDITAGEAKEGYEAEWAILSANSGKGRGWFSNKLQIEVTDHVLTVGVTNDSVFTAGLIDTDGNPTVPFTGTWFSANDFKLVMVSEGDNAGWDIVTGVQAVAATDKAVKVAAVYTISGAKVAGLQKGINIVKYTDGTVKKVLVK